MSQLAPPRPRRFVDSLSAALLCALAGLALQYTIVHVRYGGNWTALFCTGSQFPPPPALEHEDIYVFPDSTGYDGQMYHYVAHDPLARTGMARYMDNPGLRYRRILLPAAAHLLALGRQDWIDITYLGANLLFAALGAWWLARYLGLLGLPPKRGALFVFAPAVLISLDRLTVDLTLAALSIGFALYLRLQKDARAYVVLALACLTRETGFVLAAAACLALLTERRIRKAATISSAMIPALAWHLYVQSRIAEHPAPGFVFIPLKGLFDGLLDPASYSFREAVNFGLRWLDRLALVGILLAVLFSVWLFRQTGFRPMETAMVGWSFLAMWFPRHAWLDPFSGPRVFTPLLLFVILAGFPWARWKAVIPVLLVVPRVVVQVLGPLLAAIASPR